MSSAKDREDFLVEERARINAELAQLREETDEPEERPAGYEDCGCDPAVGHTQPCLLAPARVPEFRLDIHGEYYGNAYPETAEFTVRAVAQPGQDAGYLITVETSDGGVLGVVALTEAEADGVQKVAMTDHSLNAYGDDWIFPDGIDRVATWDLVPADGEYRVVLSEGQIHEFSQWLDYASGQKTWDGGEEWQD